MLLPTQTEYVPYHRRLHYRLDCGREVTLEGCCIAPSTLGVIEGSIEYIRDDIIKRLSERVQKHFPACTGGHCGLFIKPTPEGELPAYTFMVDLVCYQSVSDPSNDISSLIVCWLGDDVETSLPELIDREISSVEWERYAVDGNI